MDSMLQLPMEQITLDRRSGVSRLALDANYYVKTFRGRGSRLKFLLGISRYQRELRNLQYFETLGLLIPRIIAYGHQSRLGLMQQAVLVTAEVEHARDLAQVIASGSLYSEGIAGARGLLGQLARAARLMHADGFYHKDLKTRNVLVRRQPGQAELFFFDCPSGHRPPRFLLRRGVIRDLANLEEGLRGHVRRADLLYMYRQYRDCERLSEGDKALAREALNYHAQRRMTRKRRRRAERKRANAGGP